MGQEPAAASQLMLRTDPTDSIRWDVGGMAELANASEAKAEKLLALRSLALGAAERGGRIPDMRPTVIAAQWAQRAVEILRRRRVLLAMAENTFAAALGAIGPIEPLGWKPELRSRPVETIERDLDAALTAGREAAAAQLTIEMVVSHRDVFLMAEEPDIAAVAQLQRLIDYLAYELSRQRPRPAPDWGSAVRVGEQIKQLLDESWFRDVRRSDLVAISEIVGGLPRDQLDAVIAQLEDAHLYRLLREMDGIAGGNLATDEEATLFRSIAENASAATIFRIANAERGAKFPEIALAVATSAPPDVAIEFIELCAANAADSDHAIAAALGGLAALTPDARIVAYTALLTSGSAQLLAAATKELVAAQLIERDDPLVVEFLEGVLAGLTGVAAATWDLTGALLLDTHEFREAWAGLGRVMALLGKDPVAFVAVALDIDTLAQNPARWAGGAVADVATIGVGKLARLGRLGTTAKAIADWIRRLSTRAVAVGGLEVEAGHLLTTLDRLDGAADAHALREVIGRQIEVEDLNRELEALPGRLPRLEIEAALHLMREIGRALESLVGEISAALAA